jgi:hypothetical protein
MFGYSIVSTKDLQELKLVNELVALLLIIICFIIGFILLIKVLIKLIGFIKSYKEFIRSIKEYYKLKPRTCVATYLYPFCYISAYIFGKLATFLALTSIISIIIIYMLLDDYSPRWFKTIQQKFHLPNFTYRILRPTQVV